MKNVGQSLEFALSDVGVDPITMAGDDLTVRSPIDGNVIAIAESARQTKNLCIG